MSKGRTPPDLPAPDPGCRTRPDAAPFSTGGQRRLRARCNGGFCCNSPSVACAPFTLSAQFLHASADGREVIGGTGSGHASSPSVCVELGGRWIVCIPPARAILIWLMYRDNVICARAVALLYPFRLCQRSRRTLPRSFPLEAEMRVMVPTLASLMVLAAVSAQAAPLPPAEATPG